MNRDAAKVLMGSLVTKIEQTGKAFRQLWGYADGIYVFQGISCYAFFM